jgi:hypothetical protein
MSLYTTAQGESGFVLATNLDSSTTEKANAAGLTISSSAFGTITQNASSLTGNASYDFSSNGRVLHQGNFSGATSSFILEAVFKRSSAPGSNVTLIVAPGTSNSDQAFIDINTSGQVRGFSRNPNNNTTNATSSTNYCDGNWHHVIYSYQNSASSARLYVDGVYVAADGTIGNIGCNGQINIGSALSNSGTASAYFTGTIDFGAYYKTAGLTDAQVDTFVANHVATYADKTVAADPATASALAVHPAVALDKTVAADPATASAASGDHYNSTVTFETLLNTYMATLSLQSWFKFDKAGVLTNYGTEPTRPTYWSTGVTNNAIGGVQGSGELKLTTAGGLQAYATQAAAPTTGDVALLNDEDFTIGFWTKKLDKPTSVNSYIMTAFKTDTTQNVSFGYNTDGGIIFNIFANNSNHTVQSTTDITDGEWHFVVGKLSSNTMQLWIDGTSIGTTNMNNNLTLDYFQFDGSNSTDTTSVSQFFIATAAAIGTTQIANIYDYGTPSILQGAAIMPDASVKFNSAFNDYIESKNPVIDYRLDEGAGTPDNFGTATLELVSTLTPQGFTQGLAGLNNRTYKFTSRDQALRGTYALATGTFSTDDLCTIGVLFKNANATNQQGIVGFGGRSTGADGNGFALQMLATSGYLRILAGNNNGTVSNYTGTTNYADNKWHLAIIVKSASDVKLYVDGKEHITGSNSTAMSDNGEFVIGGIPGIFASAASRDTLIDEVFVTNTAFSAENAFDAWQALRLEMDTTATATFPMPTNIAGTGQTIAADPMIASALLSNIFPFIVPATANALFQMPNFLAVQNVSQTADVMTAAAQAENPGFDIGENNLVLHMDAAASFPEAEAFIPGFFNGNPFIALNATLVMPALSTTLGALVKAQPLNASAFVPLPPQYFTILDDLWYQRLVAIDEKDDIDGRSLVFFNTSDNFYVGSDPVPGSGWTAPLAVGKTAVNAVTNPLPAINGGYFDAQNRKAVNLRNIALTTGGSGSGGTGAADFTFEAMIKTTKSNQVLFAGTNTSIYNTQRTAIILRDGKLALTNPKDRREGSVSANDQLLAFTGFKNIADGQWHHIIIQNKKGRNQFWIDGQLDIQRYGNDMYVINTVGYNSPELNSYSDFTISAFGLNLSALVEQSEINLNYLAAINVVPVKAGVATASVTFGTGTRGKGNRARALMLYFWPTFKADSGYYVGQYNNPFAPVGVNDTEGKDVGDGGDFDYDTFYGLSTYLTESTQQFFDWDVFPLPVQRFYAGDTYRGDRNPLLKDTVKIGSGPQGDTYKDDVTDNYRYLDLMKDVYELDQYDAIFFRNYPDQSSEQDKQGLNSKTEVDEYFNLQEKELFKKFLESLREAIDTYGISLFITNPQLAVDLGIIEAATPVPLLRNNGKFNAGEYSDNRAPVLTGRVNNVGIPIDPVNEYGAGWDDTFFNDRHRVINTLEYLTDDNAFIWTDYAFYNNADEFNYGGPDRYYAQYQNRPNGLQVGDEFVFADSGNPRFRLAYQAIKPEHLKAGIPITALGAKIHEQNFDSYTEGTNPYKDYITTVALPAGTNLNGKLTGGKIFVSFSENVANSFTAEGLQFNTSYNEYHQYDLATNYWVDIAFNAGIIDANTRALYKNSSLTDAERGQPALKDDNDIIAQRWSLNGDYVVSQLIPITRNLKGFVGGEVGPEIPPQNRKRTRAGLGGIAPSTRLRDALGRFASGGGGGGATATTGGLVTYKVTTGRIYDTGTVFIPSINTRGLWWLSDKNIIEGKVVGGVGMSASANIPHPIVTADHPGGANAVHMLAQAKLVDNTSGTTNNVALPLIGSALMPTLGGRRIAAEPAVATAFIVFTTASTETDYTVTLYLNHTDPILYIRKEVIK